MLSILIATIASMAIGAFWFGPKTFYPIMMKEMEISEERQQKRMKEFNPTFHFPIVFGAEFTLAALIYGLLMVTNNDFRIMIFPVFFVLVSNIKTNIFTFLNLKLFLIQEGQKIVSILVMGIIISIMM